MGEPSRINIFQNKKKERDGRIQDGKVEITYERLFNLLELIYNVDRVRCAGNFRNSFGFFPIYQSHSVLSLYERLGRD